MEFRRFLSLMLCVCLVLCVSGAAAAAVSAPLTMRLSTRTGPSTGYTEPGTFFSNWQGVMVKVLSRAYGNGVWWVQVEFSNGGRLYRAYTGAKRVDLNVICLPEETALGTATARPSGRRCERLLRPGRALCPHALADPMERQRHGDRCRKRLCSV